MGNERRETVLMTLRDAMRFLQSSELELETLLSETKSKNDGVDTKETKQMDMARKQIIAAEYTSKKAYDRLNKTKITTGEETMNNERVAQQILKIAKALIATNKCPEGFKTTETGKSCTDGKGNYRDLIDDDSSKAPEEKGIDKEKLKDKVKDVVKKVKDKPKYNEESNPKYDKERITELKQLKKTDWMEGHIQKPFIDENRIGDVEVKETVEYILEDFSPDEAKTELNKFLVKAERATKVPYPGGSGNTNESQGRMDAAKNNVKFIKGLIKHIDSAGKKAKVARTLLKIAKALIQDQS